MKTKIRKYEAQFAHSRFDRVSELNAERAVRTIPFGVGFLDDALGGIYPTDLIVLGARTGQGKTELAGSIAESCAKRNKMATYLALEAEHSEMESRLIYREAARRFFDDPNRPHINVAYNLWYEGRIDERFNSYQAQAEDVIKKYSDHLRIIYRSSIGTFGATELQQAIMEFKADTRVFIIDHLNYIDTEDSNEIKAVTELVKNIRDLALLVEKPIILISHVRKKDRFSTNMPKLEDFYGSSNITKIATKVILMGPDQAQATGTQRRTLFHCPKHRVNGQVTMWTGSVVYDFKTNSYDQKYCLGKLDANGIFNPLPENRELPYWAQNADQTNQPEVIVTQKKGQSKPAL